MVDTSFRFWTRFFFAASRREAKNTFYKYKENVFKIRKASLKQNELKLKDCNRPVVELKISSELKKTPLSQIRKILLKDAQAPADTFLRIVRNGRSPRQGQNQYIPNWPRDSQLFENPVLPRYGLPLASASETDGTDHIFEMNQTIKLYSKEGGEVLTQVLWPQTIFSRSCRGVGVSSDLFERFSKTYNNNLPVFVNPSNAAFPLKLYKMNLDVRGCQAIGLFPSYVQSHKTVFKGLDLCAASIGSRLCSNKELKLMEMQVTSSNRQEPMDLKGVDSEAGSNNNELQIQGNINNLDKWRFQARKYCKLWSKESYNDKSCPEDILRNLFFARDITTIQLKEEYCKHFVLFGIFSQAWRIDVKLNDLDSPTDPESFEIPWKPWDLYIWQKCLEIDALPVPATLQEFSDAKLKFDGFLIELFSYYTLITAEMKANADSFFIGYQTLPRATAALQILRRILRGTNWIRTLYPNLENYMRNHLKGAHRINRIQAPSLSKNDPEWHSAHRILTVVQKVVELEHVVYHDEFSESCVGRVSKEPTTNFKVVIVCKTPIEEEICRLLKFSSRISIQFVKTLDQVDNNSWFCQERNMIDSDTFVYLYKSTKSESLSKGDLINTIITKLVEPNNNVQQ